MYAITPEIVTILLKAGAKLYVTCEFGKHHSQIWSSGQDAKSTSILIAVLKERYLPETAMAIALAILAAGSVLKVNVAAGDAVKAGDVLLVMESMKMELRIASEIDGVVASVRCKAGETVERNSIVAIVEPA